MSEYLNVEKLVLTQTEEIPQSSNFLSLFPYSEPRTFYSELIKQVPREFYCKTIQLFYNIPKRGAVTDHFYHILMYTQIDSVTCF